MKKTITKTIEVEVSVCDTCNAELASDSFVLACSRVSGELLVTYELCYSCVDKLSSVLKQQAKSEGTDVSTPMWKSLAEMDHKARGTLFKATKKISMDHNIDASTWK